MRVTRTMLLYLLAVLATACLFGCFLAILVGASPTRPTPRPEGEP